MGFSGLVLHFFPVIAAYNFVDIGVLSLSYLNFFGPSWKQSFLLGFLKIIDEKPVFARAIWILDFL